MPVRAAQSDQKSDQRRADTSTLLPLADYDRVLVMFSGGKDSTALVLHMLELLDAAGVPRTRLAAPPKSPASWTGR